MDSNTASLTPEQLELVKFGSLGSKKLRRLYFNSVESNSGEASTLNPKVTAAGATGDRPENAANTNIDVKLNLDLNNYLKRDFNSVSKTDSRSTEYKRSDKKNDTEKEWAAIREAEPTHTALREWKSIQLRGFVDPKRFYKNTKSKLEEMPRQFQIGKIVSQSKSINFGNIEDGSKSTPSGSTSQSKGRRRTRKKPSLITSMLKDDKGWVNKRYNEIQSEKTKGSKGWYQRQLKKRKRG
ncbi:uncharacterized protein TOT_020000750 [Theileria orientalis strain Shintoku]|uniref:Fcf2 pre-rRNA processing C-terminal domain-containing protein n=1 Tax=Theileria orientalis strain Shintoku TaxID=869250 RepID=J4D811_THEOR|nr:uncharacterized protein TOT_020000750 [Theileria orientalis strain Shintoku]BAM40495.1 uncharacterized protein TOT_020000750 [Theileria orientalis strain Shintoku]|eukprot:XP_009690796.1 uncharacterized protein TOT_020000750 [Theileria orientalis strain Shintoku]